MNTEQSINVSKILGSSKDHGSTMLFVVRSLKRKMRFNPKMSADNAYSVMYHT